MTEREHIASAVAALDGKMALRKLLEDQLAALTLVKTAHETGDYAALLAAVHDVEVKTEQKTRRVEVAPATTQKAREEDANRQS